MDGKVLILLAALVCLDAKQSECKVACLYEGYDGGYYVKERCQCVDSYLYIDLIQKKKRMAPKGLQTPVSDELL